MTKTLLILAGGMGSRYGGLKQIDGFGPHDESILEYSIYDAIRAGFTEVVIVLRRDFQDKFDAKFADTFGHHIGVQYVYQEIDVTQFGGTDGSHREKPRGTGHAILSAKEVISGPFAVINADDWYGSHSFQIMADALEQVDATQSCMVGYQLVQTLSPYGSVNRGVCSIKDDNLMDVTEHHSIVRDITGSINADEAHGLAPDTIVSMNFWGFDVSFFALLEKAFVSFLHQSGGDPKKECYIPFVVDDAIKSGMLACRVYPTTDTWIGVTNPDDKQAVQQLFADMVEQGVYPQYLWK